MRIFIAIEKSAKGHSSLSPGKTPLNQWGQNHLEVSFELFEISESEFEMKLSILDGIKNSKISSGRFINSNSKPISELLIPYCLGSRNEDQRDLSSDANHLLK